MQLVYGLRDKMLEPFQWKWVLIFTVLVSAPIISAQENFFSELKNFGLPPAPVVSVPVLNTGDASVMSRLVAAVDRELHQFASTNFTAGFTAGAAWHTQLNGSLKNLDLQVMEEINQHLIKAGQSPKNFEPYFESSLPVNTDEYVYLAYGTLESHLKATKNSTAQTEAKKIRANVFHEAINVAGILKTKYQRSRPLARANPLDYAFPSQHATLGRMLALYYYHFLGQQKKHMSLIEDGIRIGLNRVLSQNHHPTDIIAGEFVANQVFCHKFKQQFYVGNLQACITGMQQLPSILQFTKSAGKQLPNSLGTYAFALKRMSSVLAK